MGQENVGYGEVGVVAPPAVEDAPEQEPETSAEDEKHVCPECGKVCANPRGLKNHITCAHKRGRRPKRPGKKRKAKAVKPAASAGGFREVFEGVAKQINQVGEILDQCVGGLDVLVASAKDLRKKYIKNTSQLQKLQRAVDMGFED